MKKIIFLSLISLLSVNLFGQVTIGIQDFEATPATPTLGISSSPSFTTQSGTTTTSDLPSNVNKFAGGTQSIGTINSGTNGQYITFNPVNTTSYTNVSLTFRLAAFSIGSTGNGMESSDFVDVEVSTDGTTWSKELRVTGSTSNNAVWSFANSGNSNPLVTASKAYDGNNNTETSFSSTGTGVSTSGGIGTVILTDLPNTATLHVRILCRNNAASELWAIDNVEIKGNLNSSPNILVAPNTITGLNYLDGNGPSASQSYNLSALNLSPANGDITVTAPTNFEVSTDNSTFADNLTIPYTSGSLSATPIYVRLKAGLAVAVYGGTSTFVTNAGGGATTANVSVTGAVTDGSVCGTASTIASVRATIPVQATYTGSSFTIAGNVTAVFGANKFYVQDATGGIGVFFTNVVTTNSLAVGDVVRMTGTAVRFNGEAQLNTLTCISKISSGTAPAPAVFDSNNPPSGISLNTFLTNNEGGLIKIVSTNILGAGTFAGNTNYSLSNCNSQGNTEIRIDANATTLVGATIPTVTQDITGVVGRFINATGTTNKLQIYPRTTADISNSSTSCTITGGCGIPSFVDDPNKLDVLNWNIEWLGHPTNGPSASGVDDVVQIANAQSVLNASGADVFLLAEICQYNPANPSDNTTVFGKLIEDLNNTFGSGTYSGECSSAVSGSVSDPNPQRVCIIYKNSVVTKIFSRPMFDGFTPATYPPTGTPSQFWASGRKPFMFMGEINLGGEKDTVLFIGLHAKAGSTVGDWERRKFDVKAMYDTLQAQYPNTKTLILGDMNDDMDVSIYNNAISSYAPFLYANPNETNVNGTRPSADWEAITKPLSDAGCSSTSSFPDGVDHQIISNEFSGNKLKYVNGTASSFRPAIANYANTTSDHFIVTSRYEFACQLTRNLQSTNDDYSTGNRMIRASSGTGGKITATNKVTGTANVTYQAKAVELNAGFKADNGTIFKAEVGGCN